MKENNSQNTNSTWVAKIKNSYKEYTPAWIMGIVVVILAIVAVASPWDKNKNGIAGEEEAVVRSEGCEPGFKYDVYTGKPCAGKEGIALSPDSKYVSPMQAPATTTVDGKYPSLSEALKFYEGKSFAVGALCAITPNSQEVALGTKIMIHNATTANHTVLVAGRSLLLKPYYYRTVVLDTAGEVSLKCDGKTSATISVK